MNIQEVVKETELLLRPQARKRLLARGKARGLIWKDGQLPNGATLFSDLLSDDLLDHAFALLTRGLLIKASREPEHRQVAERAFLLAAESIESAHRRGADSGGKGFYLVIAAAAYHLAHYGARAYCLLTQEVIDDNLTSAEVALAYLIRRDFRSVVSRGQSWLDAPENSDRMVAARLSDPTDLFGPAELAERALTRNFHRSMLTFEFSLRTGSVSSRDEATNLLDTGAAAALELRMIGIWWLNVLAKHLVDDFWEHTFWEILPKLPSNDGWNKLRRKYIRLLSQRSPPQVDLWPSQVVAAKRALDPTDSIVAALPTSSGKTRIAELCILRALCSQMPRTIYVTPLRALSAQIEASLSQIFSPLGITISALYGSAGVSLSDVNSLRESQIVVSTPEKLDFAMRQDPTLLDDVGLIVLDEGHMIGLGKREIRYEILIQRLLVRADSDLRRICCLSAVFQSGEGFTNFTNWIGRDSKDTAIQSEWRPTRQCPAFVSWISAATAEKSSGKLEVFIDEEPFVPAYIQSESPIGRRQKAFPQDSRELAIAICKRFRSDGHSVLLYCPQRRSVEGIADECLKLVKQGHMPNYLRGDCDLRKVQHIGNEWLGENHSAVQALSIGVGVHHGQLPRQFLTEVESLILAKQLPMIIASPTLAQGLNLSCGVLVFYSIFRFGNELIHIQDYLNIIGRAGRAFVDLDGLTVGYAYDKVTKVRNAYKRLLKKAKDAEISSGIAQLVDKILQRIAAHLGDRVDDYPAMTEYVLNQNCAWELADDDNDEEGTAPEELLTELDTTIFGTIEKLDCEPSELAGILDEALSSSLWRRTLAKREAPERELQRLVVLKRAEWLWRRTSSNERRGCFLAGVGETAGKFFRENLDDLVSMLADSDQRIGAGSYRKADYVVESLADRLFDLVPFRIDREKAPDTWKSILNGWLRGVPMADLLGGSKTEVSARITFVQQSVVFKLVWAVEALRVYANAQGHREADKLNGNTALALTWGACDLNACYLLRAGLPLRSLAMRLAASMPETFDNFRQAQSWLSTVEGRKIRKSIAQGMDRTILDEFLGKASTFGSKQWRHSTHEVEVEWDSKIRPESGQPVRILQSEKPGIFLVCSPALDKLGTFTGPIANLDDSSILAKVADAGRLLIRRFGP